MSSDINRIILVGRATRDAESKQTNSGLTVCKFSLASNKSIYSKQSGESRDEVGYYDCVAFGKLGEVLGQYLKKGKRICVDGSLRWSSWEGTDGKKQSKTEINVETFQFLDAKPQGEQQSETQGAATFSGDPLENIF